MSTDLRTQLADYGRFHRSEQRPVDAAEAAGHLRVAIAHRPSVHPGRRVIWTVVAAALVTVVLIAGAALLVRGAQETDVVDQPAPPTSIVESPTPTTLGEAAPVELPAPRELVVTWRELADGESRSWESYTSNEQRWVAAGEQLFPELTAVSAAADGPWTVATGRREDGTTVLLVSDDGETWSEVDHSALPKDGDVSCGRGGPVFPSHFCVVQTTRSGLTWFSSSEADDDGFLAVVAGDRLIDVHDPPWDIDSSTLIETTRGVVAIQEHSTRAWMYLGQGQWSASVEIVPSGDHALVGDTILTFDHTNATCCGHEPRGASLWPLLASNDGVNWTVIDTRIGQDTHSLEIEAGDFFWVYGDQSGGGGTGIEITTPHSVLWISADGLNWEPVDVAFVLPPGRTVRPKSSDTRFVEVGGDSIYIEAGETTWVGTVQSP